MKTGFGFTLFELLIALSLFSILLMLAVPSFHYNIQRGTASAVKEQLRSAIQRARSEAITSQTRAVLSPMSGDWSLGQALKVHDQILHQYPALQRGRLSWHSFPSSDYLAFNALGMSDEQNGHFEYRNKADDKIIWTMIVSKSGRVRMESS